jgi:capsular exopolysaccharide synthesis family protein
VDHPIRKLVITSVEASDGKSTVAINLAIILAQAEKRVILVDADLRAPSIHLYLDIPENRGLSDIFLNRLSPIEGLITWEKDSNLRILPSGLIPPNSAELLGSRKMDQIIDDLSSNADILIIDGPPAFVVDSLVLSAKADGVLLVVNSGETHRAASKTIVEQLKRLGANLVGVVLNRVPRSTAYYGGYYSSAYYSEDESKKNAKLIKRRENTKPKQNLWTGRNKDLPSGRYLPGFVVKWLLQKMAFRKGKISPLAEEMELQASPSEATDFDKSELLVNQNEPIISSETKEVALMEKVESADVALELMPETDDLVNPIINEVEGKISEDISKAKPKSSRPRKPRQQRVPNPQNK